MPRAQCYYEILGIPETATTEEVKKAYKKEALIWHPDKNQANLDEAHAKFQTILKAYETLSDNREREWYDRHKDQILSDGGKEAAENCLNLFQFFSSACYANFDDSEDGFYTVYRNVFEKIAEEEREAMSQINRSRAKSKAGGSNRNNEISTDSLPSFGDSQSFYEEVVRPFYAFWSGFCTSLTFDFKDKYNTLEAENRRIVRAMEKENKKIKDAARKERNTNVRNLVEFIKKRDKRLKAHKLLVEQQNELNRQKTAEKHRQQREKLSKEKAEYKPSAYLGMDDVEEQLRQLESEYQDELKKGKRARRRRNQIDDDDEDDDNVEDNDYQEDANGDVDGDKQANGDGASPPVANGVVMSDEDNANDNKEDDDEEEEDNFYCAACNKEFRTINAFENHEASRKHKQNVQKLTKLLEADEHKLR